MAQHPIKALRRQVGGEHYTRFPKGYQPLEISMKLGFNACQHTILKYLMRYKFKGGVEDIDKMIHTAGILKDIEYGE